MQNFSSSGTKSSLILGGINTNLLASTGMMISSVSQSSGTTVITNAANNDIEFNEDGFVYRFYDGPFLAYRPGHVYWWAFGGFDANSQTS